MTLVRIALYGIYLFCCCFRGNGTTVSQKPALFLVQSDSDIVFWVILTGFAVAFDGDSDTLPQIQLAPTLMYSDSVAVYCFTPTGSAAASEAGDGDAVPQKPRRRLMLPPLPMKPTTASNTGQPLTPHSRVRAHTRARASTCTHTLSRDGHLSHHSAG